MLINSLANNFSLLTLDEPLPPENRQRLLRFPLGKESAMLPLEQIVEILRVNWGEILLVPEMPSCVLGIYNWRGEMLWLVDLNNLIGGASGPQQRRGVASSMVMVVQVNDQSVGLVVPQVNDIELHELQQLQSAGPGLFSPQLLPFVLGALPGGKGTVLDINAIARSPLWQIHHQGNT
jgi:positive phototaxis protein PixI